MNARSRSILLASSLLLFTACDHGAGETGKPAPSASSSASAAPASVDKIQWTKAPEGLLDATPLVREAYAKEHAAGRTLLVYVGATWCEPCQRFHHAVEGGQLDAQFPKLSILAFDADKDTEALANAGYFSRLIPLLALPGADGRASGKQIEGGIKGDGAVGYIAPRLKELLAGGS